MQIDRATVDGGLDQGLIVFLCTASGRVLSASPRADELFPADGKEMLRERLEQRLSLGAGQSSLTNSLIDGQEGALRGQLDNREATLSITPLNENQRLVVLLESHRPLDNRDTLTGLPDRSTMIKRIREILSEGESGRRLMLVDIDRLKTVNDYLGYHVGDRVIRDLARAMRAILPDDVMLARWSGHEFMLLMPPRQAENSPQIAERIRAASASITSDDDIPHLGMVTVSIGHGALRPDETSHTPLRDQLSALNAAVYEAKRTGRDRVINADQLRQPSVYITGGALDRAINEGRIVAASQPIVDLKTGQVVADEALARMLTPEGDVIPAGLFIEAASRLQMTHRIDFEIINQAISNCITSISHRPMAHFVNISGDFLQHPELMEQVISSIRQACSGIKGDVGVKPLVLEMTEREVLDDTADALAALKPLIDFGLRLALDDFGSGYSSYRYLLDIPFTFLKIEGALVQNMGESLRARKIVQHIQAMARDLGLITVAEFIGDQRTADLLRDMGVDWGQGFHFGHPKIIQSASVAAQATSHTL
ncbi:MAG TPA: bifunctional diguanylate cyclase/phosphodiesterase [Guyparkeria sp.]|nr:bifunctional diguanylate cyclase/phosphodiesterase [Guyparkeria sp.]